MRGRIHIGPPDHHLIISAGRMFLVDGPREKWVRPAADPMFRSAARSLGRAKDAAERAELVRAAVHCLVATVNETTEAALAEG